MENITLTAEDEAKLVRVRTEIEEIMKREDIGGFFLLHRPGGSKFLLRLDPEYSCLTYSRKPGASLEDPVEVRIRAKAEDYPNGAVGRNIALAATDNLLLALNAVLTNQLTTVRGLYSYYTQVTGGFEHFDPEE